MARFCQAAASEELSSILLRILSKLLRLNVSSLDKGRQKGGLRYPQDGDEKQQETKRKQKNNHTRSPQKDRSETQKRLHRMSGHRPVSVHPPVLQLLHLHGSEEVPELSGQTGGAGGGGC